MFSSSRFLLLTSSTTGIAPSVFAGVLGGMDLTSVQASALTILTSWVPPMLPGARTVTSPVASS